VIAESTNTTLFRDAAKAEITAYRFGMSNLVKQ
jgi:hypothetical protein